MAEELRRVDTPLGPIEYFLTVKSVKNINLRIRSDGTAAVSVPRRVSKARADDFVRSRAAWVMEQSAPKHSPYAPLITAHKTGESLRRNSIVMPHSIAQI